MVLKVKMYGSGKANDPYRVKLPTYDLMLGDIKNMVATVHVPDEVFGLSDADLAGETLSPTTEGSQLLQPSNAILAKLQAALDTNYPGTAGTYAPEVVA